MENPKLVVKVENDTGDELLRAIITADMAGRFLENIGSQLRFLSGAVAPAKPVSPDQVERKDS